MTRRDFSTRVRTILMSALTLISGGAIYQGCGSDLGLMDYGYGLGGYDYGWSDFGYGYGMPIDDAVFDNAVSNFSDYLRM